MEEPLEDRNLISLSPLVSPHEVKRALPVSPRAAVTVRATRTAIRDVLHGRDRRRLLVVVGPCSIHDPTAALEYADAPAARRRSARDDALVVVMRTYFEKPRTTVGWKGLINDPHLDGSCDIGHGPRARARASCSRSTSSACRARASCSIRSVPQYIADLIELGGDRRAHHREPDPPRDGERPVDAGRVQERHRRRACAWPRATR